MMTRMIELADGRMIPLHRINEIYEGDGESDLGRQIRPVIARVQNTAYTLMGNMEYVEAQLGEIIPAHEGWAFAVFVERDPPGRPYATTQPIVAWRIYRGVAHPVLVTNDQNLINRKALIAPWGKVFSQEEDEEFETLVAWIEHCVKGGEG